MFQYLFYISVFLVGLAVGSFLNCVIYRLETNQSFLRGRSFCPYCQHILSWQDLIPLLSFFILKGRCRYCHREISWQYPLVELATGLIILLIFNLQPTFALSQFVIALYLFIITCFLVVIFTYDLKHYIIPDRVLYPAIVITFLYNIFYSLFVIHNSKLLIQSLFSAFGAAIFFLLFILISRGAWMGGGDVKLAFFMGLFLGWPNILVALFLTFLVGAIIGIGLILFGKKTLKSEIPLGPFLVFGTFIALFWGGPLIKLYLKAINLGWAF